MEGSGTNEGQYIEQQRPGGPRIPQQQQQQQQLQQQQQFQQQQQQQQQRYQQDMMHGTGANHPGVMVSSTAYPHALPQVAVAQSFVQPHMQTNVVQPHMQTNVVRPQMQTNVVRPQMHPGKVQVGDSNVPPLPTSHVKLPKPITVGMNQSPTTVNVIYYQFFQRYPDMWVKFNLDYQLYCKEIFHTYLLWGKMVKEQSEQAKRLRESETVRGRLQRKIKQRYEQAEKVVRRDWPSIHEPKTDDEKKFLPSTRAAHLVRTCCGSDVTLQSSAELALELLAKSFVEDAVSFGVAMARRRPKSGVQEIQSNDIALFMRTAWNIMLPSSDGVVRGYSVNVPKANYKSIEAATRKENAIEGRPLFHALQAQEQKK